jgi:hypothetical protein
MRVRIVKGTSMVRVVFVKEETVSMRIVLTGAAQTSAPATTSSTR